MNYLQSLFLEPSVTQSIAALTCVIAVGLFLAEKLKINKFSLGVTWILFFGILVSHFGIRLEPTVAGFAKDFGLILFVYSIGLQVGPAFFSSFGKGGLKLNMFALSIVLLSAITTYIIHVVTGEDLSTMVGVMSGAITNTPSLGAAEQAYSDTYGSVNANIASGYAVAYPLGVLGIIFSMLVIRWIFRIKPQEENERVQQQMKQNQSETILRDILVTNPQLNGITIQTLHHMCNIKMVVSRIIHADGHEQVPTAQSTFSNGDTLRILTDKAHEQTLQLIGKAVEAPLVEVDNSAELVSRRIVVTKSQWNGKYLKNLNINEKYHVTITRIYRAGVQLLATSDIALQMGDRMVIVGTADEVKQVADLFGNEMKRLDAPNLIPIFLGILLGVLFGLMPIKLPGMAVPFKLGLAGGTLIVAILIGRYGPYHHLVTFATTSANRMIREIGLCLFLAAVGLGAGESFVPAIQAGGYWWIVYGVIITLIPLLIIGIIARKWGKLDYFTLMGLIAGSTTDPPALSYASSVLDDNDLASVSYATVYPLTMFLRVMVAQIMILLLL